MLYKLDDINNKGPNPDMIKRADQSGIDPSCGKPINEKTENFKSFYGPKKFFFCSEECKTKFDSDVYKYPSAYNISVSHIPFKARKKIYGKNFKILMKTQPLLILSIIVSSIALIFLEFDLLWLGIICAIFSLIFVRKLKWFVVSRSFYFIALIIAITSIVLIKLGIIVVGIPCAVFSALIFYVGKLKYKKEKPESD